jgi:hypothetical protein
MCLSRFLCERPIPCPYCIVYWAVCSTVSSAYASRGQNWVCFVIVAHRLGLFLLLSFPQPHPRSSAVLIDELDAGEL